jgi:hypothetical protein
MSAVPEPEDRLTKAEVETAISGLSPADWQRAETIARGFCSGLTGWTPDDLLQDTLAALLDESRIWPRDLHPLVVLKTAMHSVSSNARKRNKGSPIDENVVVDPFEAEEGDKTPVAYGEVTITPEDELSGKQRMARLYEKLGGNKELEELVTAWACGARGAEAREMLGWDEKTYDAARNRLQRRLDALDDDRRPE